MMPLSMPRLLASLLDQRLWSVWWPMMLVLSCFDHGTKWSWSCLVAGFPWLMKVVSFNLQKPMLTTMSCGWLQSAKNLQQLCILVGFNLQKPISTIMSCGWFQFAKTCVDDCVLSLALVKQVVKFGNCPSTRVLLATTDPKSNMLLCKPQKIPSETLHKTLFYSPFSRSFLDNLH